MMQSYIAHLIKMSIILVIWADLKLLATIVLLPFYTEFVVGILDFSYKDYLEQFYFLIIFIMMEGDVAFGVILMLASFTNSLHYFKLYFAYGIVYVVSLPVNFLSWVSYAILVRDLDWRNDHVKKNLLITSSVLASVFIVHLYALFLIKKRMNKLKVGHKLQFGKQISSSMITLLSSEKKSEVAV